ncbi:MAG TPA: protein-L-isoaspartate(D-aspartate) O-methyltransferase [Anaerolineales bacterium]
MSLRFTFPPDECAKPRERMVRDQIESRGVSDPRVLEAMRAVPRHRFLSADERASAYDDTPLPIGSHQTISQPYIVAYMTAALELEGEEKVLEIGTGSGYQTSILACLSRAVYSVERIPELANRARENLRELEIDNAEVIIGDGTVGLPDKAPFDAILVTAGTPILPDPLLEQLAPSGRLIAPVGGRGVQELEFCMRTPSGIERRRLISVVFVPLIGKYGWEKQ